MAFDLNQVEDGSGLPTAVVYEQPEDAAEWLATRGKIKLRDADEEVRNAALLVATETAEEAVRPFLENRSTTRTVGQGLLFPRLGAYDSTGELLDEDAIPTDPGRLSRYLRGIRLLAELAAAGTLMKKAGGPAGVKEERSRYGGITYRDGVDLSTLASNHPEEWRLISCAIPRL